LTAPCRERAKARSWSGEAENELRAQRAFAPSSLEKVTAGEAVGRPNSIEVSVNESYVAFGSKPEQVRTMRSNTQHVSPHRNSRLAVILFATALTTILWDNTVMAMTLNSPAYEQNGHIPSKYTCEGEDISPPLAWEGVPNGAKSLVLIIDDPDAPDPKAPKMVWVHWVVYNMPPDTKSLPENASKLGLPQGTLAGVNDFKKTGYGGPCPPIGRHRYFHKLYALDTTLDLRGATKSQIERAIQGHVLANTELIGTYQKVNR
jgi:Raf kinase inhibitor-like YbhB/YbcL family protein